MIHLSKRFYNLHRSETDSCNIGHSKLEIKNKTQNIESNIKMSPIFIFFTKLTQISFLRSNLKVFHNLSNYNELDPK